MPKAKMVTVTERVMLDGNGEPVSASSGDGVVLRYPRGAQVPYAEAKALGLTVAEGKDGEPGTAKLKQAAKSAPKDKAVKKTGDK